jgi:hypothetical protein
MNAELNNEAYVMPQVHRGQAVLFYPNGLVNESQATIGYVTLVGRTSIELNAHGMLKETVCHVSDPLLKENIHVRKCGAWDFSRADKVLNQRLEELELKVAALESANQKPSK